jgi:transcriptional regulator with XRE-family HTH domain
MITGGQVRAARGFLKWSIADLASKSGVSVPTIQRLEQADGIPGTKAQTLVDLRAAFEEAGLEFIGTPDNGLGVRFRPKD